MFYVLLVCLLVLACRHRVDAYYPKYLPYPEELDIYMNSIFVNLTALICKDATMKLWHADRVQERYKHSLSYELGTISAGIQDHFKHMLEVYKEYSNLTNFRLGKHYIEETLSAYAIVKGDFNELRMEKNLYYSVLKKFQDREKKEQNAKVNIKDLLKKTTLARRQNVLEERFKENLRREQWLKKWDHFDPKVEGVDVEGFDGRQLGLMRKTHDDKPF